MNITISIPIYTSLEVVDTSQGDRTIIVPSPFGYCRMTVRCPYDFMGPARERAATLRAPTTIARVYDRFGAKLTILNPALSSRSPCGAHTGIVIAMCLRTTGLRCFQICHCAELNTIVEATMPVNPYEDRKVSLQSRESRAIVARWYCEK